MDKPDSLYKIHEQKVPAATQIIWTCKAPSVTAHCGGALFPECHHSIQERIETPSVVQHQQNCWPARCAAPKLSLPYPLSPRPAGPAKTRAVSRAASSREANALRQPRASVPGSLALVSMPQQAQRIGLPPKLGEHARPTSKRVPPSAVRP